MSENEKFILTEEERTLVGAQLARIRTYQGLINEASASFEGIIKMLAAQRKLNLAEYALSEDGNSFVKRPEQTPRVN